MKLTSILDNIISEVGEGTAKPYNYYSIHGIQRSDEDNGAHDTFTFKTEDGDTYEVMMAAFWGDNYLAKKPVGPHFTIDFWVKKRGSDTRDTDVVVNKGRLFRVMATVVQMAEEFMDLVDYKENNIKFSDVVVDKIIPKQESNELDIFVEEYGMILIDENHEKIFKESEIVRYGDYEYEFRKKLWMLNGYHLCLSYFGLANNLKYIHELFTNKKTKDFTEKMGKEFIDSVLLLKNEDRVQLERFMDTIHKRFSNSMINDELIRVARNPFIKFAKNERFHGPLDLLIENNKSIDSFKQVLDILYRYDFSFVEGYKEFKEKVLGPDKSIMYTSYWGQDLKLESYLEKLGK